MIQLKSRGRRWWMALAVTVLLGAPAALALTTITFFGKITAVSSAVTDPDIDVGDPFELIVMFEEGEISGSGIESVTLSNNSAFSLSLRIDGKEINDASDDRFGSPVLTLRDGRFNALQFTSKNYNDLGPPAYTTLSPTRTMDRVKGLLEILRADGGDENQPLVLGRFEGFTVMSED